MFNGMEKLDTPMFTRPPKWLSWNREGKVLWGGETLEAVLSDDPDGPAYYVAQRGERPEWYYKLYLPREVQA